MNVGVELLLVVRVDGNNPGMAADYLDEAVMIFVVQVEVVEVDIESEEM